MKLSIDPSVVVGMQMEDLQPLQENCFGFFPSFEYGRFVYSIPLSDCGAEVTIHVSILKRVEYLFVIEIK